MGIQERPTVKPPPFDFKLRLEDFDLSLLPIAPAVLQADPQLLQQAISEYYAGLFRPLGGTANVAIADGVLHVAWQPQQGIPRDLLFERALGLLQKGDYRAAEPLLQSLHARFPDDPDVLFNYGMMLSDQGKLGPATAMLARLVALQPDHSHGWTAFGVALSRKGDAAQAVAAFQTALKLDPNNGYAARNAGAALSRSSPSEALPFFKQALALLPKDQPTLFGYGRCLHQLNRTEEADSILKQCVDLNPLTEVAEQARTLRTSIAHHGMREKAGGGLRPDVVMYCLGALQKFRELGLDKTRAITVEVAMLGRNGLDINDPAQKYTLRSLPGQFSGLHLVSLMYVGVKQFDPKADAGIDLSREYQEALQLFK
jgi:tetratricopeptide (TPR) repeat protein